MKVSLNIKFIEGPYGGGMQFTNSLKSYLEKNEVETTNNLMDEDIDIIFHVAPFPFQEISAYSFLDAYIYKIKHPNTAIILRVNECDERKNTKHINNLIVQASKYSDYIVYIASWLKPLMEKSGLDKNKPNSVILNGADENIFNTLDKIKWNGKEKLKIVTHHWGGNYMKGHDIYKKLDNLLKKETYKNKFEFTFIGNYPHDIAYENTTLIKSLSGKELADKLRRNHVYLTASRNEPAGMHHIEGILCGLPILYIDSGAIPEYCKGYGIKFEYDNLERKINEMYAGYEYWYEKIKSYDKTSKKMCTEYYDLFKEISKKIKNKKNNNKCLSIIKIYILKIILNTYSTILKTKICIHYFLNNKSIKKN